MPGYLEKEDALKAAGIDEVMIYCVNDGGTSRGSHFRFGTCTCGSQQEIFHSPCTSAVMKAWAADQKTTDSSIIKMYGDPSGEFTRAVDMELVHPGPISKGIIGRCKRFALYVVDGEVKFSAVAEDPEFDPAGDEFPEPTLVEALLKAVAECS